MLRTYNLIHYGKCNNKGSQCLVLQTNRHKIIASRNIKILPVNLQMEITLTEEEQIEFSLSTQEIHLKYQISKAKLNGTKLELLLVIHRFTFEGPVETKIVQQRQWLIDFYLKEANINIQNGCFFPRIDAGLVQESGNIAANVLLVCGIDLLQTHAIINKYSKQNPQVAWIDASHCKLTFQNEEVVQQFLSNQLVNKGDAQQFPLRRWVQTEGYVFLNQFKRKVYVRNYNQRDLVFIDAIEKNDSIYQNFKRANKELEYNLLKNQKIRMIFEQSVVEGIVHQMIGPNAFRKKKKQTIEKMAQDRSNFIQSRNNPKAYVQRHKSCPRKEASFQSQQNHKQQVNLPVYAQQMVDQKSRYSLEYYKKVFIPDLINNNLNKIKPKNKTDLMNEYIPESVNISEKILEKKKRAHAEYKNKTMEQILAQRNFHTLIHEFDLLSKEEYHKFSQKAKKKTKPVQKLQPSQNETSFHCSSHPNTQFQDIIPQQQNLSFRSQSQIEVIGLPKNSQKETAATTQKYSLKKANNHQHNWQNPQEVNYQNYFMAPKKRSALRNYNRKLQPQPLPLPEFSNGSSIPENSNHNYNFRSVSFSGEYVGSKTLSNFDTDQNNKAPLLHPIQNNLQISHISQKISQNKQSIDVSQVKTSTSGIISIPSNSPHQVNQKATQGKDIFQKLQSIKIANPSIFLQPNPKAEWPFKPIPANPMNNREAMSFLNK